MLSASRTVAALAAALSGTMVAHILVSAALQGVDSVRNLLIVSVLVAVGAGVAGLVLVLPVLLLVPRLRTVPWWAAAAWGAVVAILATLLIAGMSIERQGIATMASLGAASGIAYSIAARILAKKSVAE